MRSVTIVLPLYKPKKDWVQQFLSNKEQLAAFLPDVDLAYVIVHDGPVCPATGNMAEVLQSVCSNVTFFAYGQNRGKGYALRYGVHRTLTPFTLLMDFDFPYALENVREVVAALMDGYDIVSGKRTNHYFKQLPVKRKLISKTYSMCNRLLFELPVWDTQSGLKGFNRKGKQVFLQTRIDRFLVDTEFLLRSFRKALSIKVIDIHLRPHVHFSNFGMAVLRTELKNMLTLVSLQRRFKAGRKRKTTHANDVVVHI